MSEEPNSNTKDIIDAATGFVQAVPIYPDAIQPAAKEIGKSLQTVAKLINVALAPVKACVWGYEKIEDFITESLNKKLADVAEENIVEPDPSVVGPSLEALRFAGNNEDLREMYANLIANSMDQNTAGKSHPGFVEIIKNLSTHDAKILNYFGESMRGVMTMKIKSGTGHKEVQTNIIYYQPDDIPLTLIASTLENLRRLGLISISYSTYIMDETVYDEILQTAFYTGIKAKLEADGHEILGDKGLIKLTDLGKQFRNTCIVDKSIAC
jgi:hypothetical protein